MAGEISCSYVDAITNLPCQLSGSRGPFFQEGQSQYCQYHLPLEPRRKEKKLGKHAEPFERNLRALTQRQNSKGGEVVMHGVHFMKDPFTILLEGNSSNIDISRSQIYVEAVARSSLIGLTMQGTIWHEAVTLPEQFQVQESIDLSDAEFRKEVGIQCHLGGDIDCSRADFHGPFSLRPKSTGNRGKAVFVNTNWNEGCQISANAHFASVDFSNASVRGGCVLVFTAEHTTFVAPEINVVDLLSITMKGGQCRLVNDLVEGSARPRLNCVKFTGKFSVIEIQEWEIDTIDSADVSNVESFVTARNYITKSFESRGATIEELEVAESEVFGKLDFRGANFASIELYETIFHKSVSFQNALFNDLGITDCVCKGNVHLGVDALENDDRKPFDRMVLTDTKFKNFSMRHRLIRDSFNAGRISFESAPNFAETQFTSSTNFDLDISSYGCRGRHATGTYRWLKKQMSDSRNRDAQGLFHALEQRSDRISLESSLRKKSGSRLPPWLLSTRRFLRLDWWLSWIYDRLSTYGFSAAKPLKKLVYLFIGFTGLYWWKDTGWLIDVSASFDVDSLRRAVVVSLRQTVSPFWDIRGAKAADMMVAFNFVQSGLSVLFLALTLLAIRWKFRRD